MSYWKHKVALVTGGSAGLGRALAETFAAAGAKVAIAARGQAGLAEVASHLEARGLDVLAVQADVTRDEDVARLVAQTLERFGKIDALVNCAGHSTRGAILDVSPAEFQAAWELNFLAAVRCTRAAASHLIAVHGHLINIGSLASKSAARHLGAYPASKFALAAYTQQLRLELRRRGLNVLLVCPGPIARDDGGMRYEAQAAGLPAAAKRPGGGVKVRAIDPWQLSRRILLACQQHRAELVVPGRSRLLFAASQLSPKFGDWLLEKFT